MPANIEIKARVANPARLAELVELVEAISDRPVEILDQEDLFFVVSRGRLKLRTFDERRGELIFYERPSEHGPHKSEYRILPTCEPLALRSILAAALPTLATVSKRRRLYHAGQTRIHLDDVDGLGDFIELEVVLADGQADADGIAIAHDLMTKLKIDESQLVALAYVDLILGNR